MAWNIHCSHWTLPLAQDTPDLQHAAEWGNIPVYFPCLCSLSFLSMLSCYWQLFKKRYWAEWRPSVGSHSPRGTEERQLLCGGTCLGVHGKPGLSRRDEGESVHLVVRRLGLPSSLTQSTGTGAAGQLSNRFLLGKSKSFPKKAGASIQTEDIVALWNSLTMIIETVFSIFEIWRLWSVRVQRWAEVKDRERMHGSF